MIIEILQSYNYAELKWGWYTPKTECVKLPSKQNAEIGTETEDDVLLTLERL